MLFHMQIFLLMVTILIRGTFHMQYGHVLNNTWAWINGSWYYFDDLGQMADSGSILDGNWEYHFDRNGHYWKSYVPDLI